LAIGLPLLPKEGVDAFGAGQDPAVTALKKKGVAMLYYALVFLVVAIIAGLLGFGAVAFAAAGVAKILFFIFLVLFLLSLFRHISSRA
jgi:uncharacterized membrane protein YtjA (UPF0391 family)